MLFRQIAPIRLLTRPTPATVSPLFSLFEFKPTQRSYRVLLNISMSVLPLNDPHLLICGHRCSISISSLWCSGCGEVQAGSHCRLVGSAPKEGALSRSMLFHTYSLISYFVFILFLFSWHSISLFTSSPHVPCIPISFYHVSSHSTSSIPFLYDPIHFRFRIRSYSFGFLWRSWY